MNILVTVQLMLQKLIQCRFQLCRTTEKKSKRKKKDLKARYPPSCYSRPIAFFLSTPGCERNLLANDIAVIFF